MTSGALWTSWIAVVLAAAAPAAKPAGKPAAPAAARPATAGPATTSPSGSASSTAAAKPPTASTAAPRTAAERAPTSASAKAPATDAAATPPPAGPASPRDREEDVTRYTFTGLDIEGELRTPALLQFLARIGGEFETVGIPHRSFMPELAQTITEDAL